MVANERRDATLSVYIIIKQVSKMIIFTKLCKVQKYFVNKRPDGLYSSAEILQQFANKIIWGGLIYKRESERINTPHC